MLSDLFTDAPNGWDILLAAVIAIVGWIVSGFARRGMLKLLAKVPNLGVEISSLLARLVRYGLLLLTLGIVLTVLGAELQPLLAAVIIVVAVAVLALRGIAANLGAGLIIQTRHVVHVGDEIRVLEFSGVVKELNGRSVVIHSTDGSTVRIPNSMLLDQPLVSLTERNLHRSEIEVRVKTQRGLEDVASVLLKTLGSTERVRAVPAPQALLAASDAHVATFRVRFWHDPHHRSEARSIVIRSLAAAREAEKIPAAIDWSIPARPFTPPPEFCRGGLAPRG